MLSEVQIMCMASDLRQELGLAEADIAAVIGDAGYTYIEKTLPEDVSGFSMYLGSGRYAIGFNPAHCWSKGFRRFTIAHELAHVTIPAHRALLQATEIHQSQPEFRSRDNDLEREADRFAVHFLTPAHAFREQARFKEYCPDTILGLARHFGTSVYATALRYVELTDQSCALFVCNSTGKILYEKRSGPMLDEYRQMRLLNREAVRPGTLVHDWIKGNQSEQQCRLGLEDWYDDCPEGIEATETVIALGYGSQYFSLLIPDEQQVHEEDEW